MIFKQNEFEQKDLKPGEAFDLETGVYQIFTDSPGLYYQGQIIVSGLHFLDTHFPLKNLAENEIHISYGRITLEEA